jgi:hypothetical protein
MSTARHILALLKSHVEGEEAGNFILLPTDGLHTKQDKDMVS